MKNSGRENENVKYAYCAAFQPGDNCAAGAAAIERQLSYEEGSGVRAAYNYAEFLPERRKMLQAWADYIPQNDPLSESIHSSVTIEIRDHEKFILTRDTKA